MSPHLLTLGALFVTAIFWSTSGAVVKLLLVSFDPIPLGMLRLFFASLIMLPLLLTQRIDNWKQFLKDVLPISLAGAANFLLFIFGVERTTANATAIIYTATPLLTAVVSAKAIGESSSRIKLIGIFVGFLGVIAILVLPLFENGQGISGDVWGNLFILGAVFLWSSYNIGSRYLTTRKHYSPIAISSSMIIVSFISTFFLTLVSGQTNFIAPLFVGSNFFFILYMAIFVTVVTFVLHQYVVKHTSATTGTFTNYLVPVFAFIADALILGEVLTPGFFFGSLLVFSGVFIATGERILRWSLPRT